MKMLRLTFICLLIGACTAYPLQEDDLWSAFQNRCLSPFLESNDFVTEGLQPVPPETVIPEEDSSSPLLVRAKAYQSRLGGWKMFLISKDDARLCMILSQRDHSRSLQAAADWAANAVENDGFMYDHHFGDEIKKGSITISFGDHIRGWKTAFLVDGDKQ